MSETANDRVARRAAAARDRKRRQRARQKGGLVVRQIEVDEAAIDEWLLAAGLIHPAGCDDPAAQREALERAVRRLVIDSIADDVTRDSGPRRTLRK